MRKLVCAALALLPAIAFCQSEDYTMIQQGYSAWRQFSGVEVQVNTSEQVGEQNLTSNEDVQWFWDPATAANTRMLATDAQNGYEVGRVYADGSTLWAYNDRNNEYTAHTYGQHAGQDTSTYRRDLIQRFNALARLPGAYAARVLREVFGDSDSVLHPWNGDATPTILAPGEGPETDPISNRQYTPTATREFVMYETSTRSVVFQLDQITMPDQTQQWAVTNIYQADNSARQLTLQITLSPIADTPSADAFSFTPPEGARVIAADGR